LTQLKSLQPRPALFAAPTPTVPKVPVWAALPADCIDLARLPETGSALFGRDNELKLLDSAWTSDSTSSASTSSTRVLIFTAHGGVGKSTLVNHWLDEMKRDNFRGASRVFGWSFYSQGFREQGTASGETFVAEALRFFGDQDPIKGSAWDKGQRLASLVGDERALLVLDGLEPLQSPHDFDRGKLRDPGIESLLRGLARNSAGLCLITTREPLADLKERPGVEERDLEQISPQAGRALLRTAKVVGSDSELEDLADRFGPHALAVTLLGVYLHEQPGRGVDPARDLEKLPGKEPIDRVLAGFEKWLGDSPELEALRLLGFFDRPADEGCLKALRAKPAISGVTDLMAELTEADWISTLARLEKLRLVHLQQCVSGKQLVDAHPLLREHFAAQLKEENLEGWKAGHKRLYEHLCETTQDKPQPTLEDLQPLYQAVAHGCLAGLQQEACDKIYLNRIGRGEGYAVHKLGAFGSALGAVACFFEEPWRRGSPALTEDDQAWLLNEAAFCLRAMGRLTEALEPMRAGLEMRISQKIWNRAAIIACNLSELELTLGEVDGAMKDGEQSVAFADRSEYAFVQSKDTFFMIASRATHADALHQAGRREEANALFIEAEKIQVWLQFQYPMLYSLQGVQYCDLLLSKAEQAAWQAELSTTSLPTEDRGEDDCRDVERRAAQTLQWATDWKLSLLTIALDHLTLGRAALYWAILERLDLQNQASGLGHIDQAVADLRRAGTQHFLPQGLLTRAWFRFLIGRRTSAESSQADLDEAWEFAERGPMRLFMADIHLHRARLFFREDSYPWQSPEHDLKEARRLIEKCGYWRRKKELEDAERAILGEEEVANA